MVLRGTRTSRSKRTDAHTSTRGGEGRVPVADVVDVRAPARHAETAPRVQPNVPAHRRLPCFGGCAQEPVRNSAIRGGGKEGRDAKLTTDRVEASMGVWQAPTAPEPTAVREGQRSGIGGAADDAEAIDGAGEDGGVLDGRRVTIRRQFFVEIEIQSARVWAPAPHPPRRRR